MGNAKRGDPYYSPMPGLMRNILLLALAGCGVFAGLYHLCSSDWLLSCAITCGMFAYHIAIRFLAPLILRWVFHRRYDYRAPWFQPKAWEARLYARLKVKSWKAHIMTYDPREFSLQLHTPEEIVVNMCHAELVHELIVVLSFTSLLFAIPFGSFWVFFITAVLAALLDCVFVLLQRYNRPRMVRLMEKHQKRAV